LLDLGYLGKEKDFPEQISLHYHIKGKKPNKRCQQMKKKKIRTKFIQKRV